MSVRKSTLLANKIRNVKTNMYFIDFLKTSNYKNRSYNLGALWEGLFNIHSTILTIRNAECNRCRVVGNPRWDADNYMKMPTLGCLIWNSWILNLENDYALILFDSLVSSNNLTSWVCLNTCGPYTYAQIKD